MSIQMDPDFQFENKRGYKTTVEGLSEKFNPEYWNYAKLISGVLRYRMPIDHVIKLVSSLQLKSESINTWKNGVERALKKYVTDGTEAKGQKCPNCGHESLIYQEGADADDIKLYNVAGCPLPRIPWCDASREECGWGLPAQFTSRLLLVGSYGE